MYEVVPDTSGEAAPVKMVRQRKQPKNPIPEPPPLPPPVSSAVLCFGTYCRFHYAQFDVNSIANELLPDTSGVVFIG